MTKTQSRLTVPMMALALTLSASAGALAGGGNMNPAGSDPQPDPHQAGQSSAGTGEPSRASSADTKADRMEEKKLENSDPTKKSETKKSQ